MMWLDLIAVTLATGAIIDVWHNGSVFATARAITQAKQDVAEHGTLTALWTELLMCPFCKSYHIPIYLFALLWTGQYVGGMLLACVQLVVYGLAATRLSNLLNGLLPRTLQYDRAGAAG
jgi:hypothetical protein